MSIKIGGRAKGQSAIAASAYRSGEKLKDYETGLTSDYSRKQRIVCCGIELCKNAPEEYANRETLWNAVHKIEKSKDARLWREIEVALPRELNQDEQIATVKEFVNYLTQKGMCADWAIHDSGDNNPHAHIMLTTRSILPNGKWAGKSRKVYDLDENGERIFQKIDKTGRKQYKCHTESYNNWNDKERVEEWRAVWAECCNTRLSEQDRIDHRSYARQGINQIPTIHEGYVARQRVADGISSDRVQLNDEIRQQNSLLESIENQVSAIESEIQQLKKAEIQEKGESINAGKQRIADLLARRSRADNHAGGGLADRERAIQSDTRETSGGNRSEGETDTDALIRQAETIGASAKADVADTRTTIEQSKSKVESSTASRADREVERQRLAAETDKREREAAERAREAKERARKASHKHSL